MVINIILPFTSFSGGVKVVFDYANRLMEKNNDVLIYVPMVGYKFNDTGLYGLIRRTKNSLSDTILRKNKVDWFDLKVSVKLVPLIKNIFIRNADITIATAWPTAFDVDRLDISKGKKVYFIQHYEVWSGMKEEVDKTYLLPLNQIVIADWLKKLMKNNFDNNNAQIAYNGIDFDEFNNNYKHFDNKVICMMYHSLEWKGYKEGLKAFEAVKVKLPNLKLIVFGMEKSKFIPDYAEFHINPSRKELKQIYSKSDVFIFPSKTEGWGLTVLEAMACKCAVVGTNVGAINEIGENGENVLVSEPGDVELLSGNLYKILNDTDLMKKISINGYDTALNFSWDKSVDRFEKILKSYK